MGEASLAEKRVCNQLVKTLNEAKSNENDQLRILNIGAGKTFVIEQYLIDNKCDIICDRIDVVDCNIDHPSVDNCWQCSVEAMTPVDSNNYNAVFSNYVLEHIPDLRKASKEIYRILKPSGQFISSIPNVKAPEFFIARFTPTWFHQLVRRHSHAYDTPYAYKSVDELIEIFEAAGFRTVEASYYPHLELYLERLSSFLGKLGKMYDQVISKFEINRLMGSTCVIFEKPR